MTESAGTPTHVQCQNHNTQVDFSEAELTSTAPEETDAALQGCPELSSKYS